MRSAGRRTVRPRRGIHRRHRLQGLRGLAVLRAVHRPRHHRRSLTAGASRRPRRIRNFRVPKANLEGVYGAGPVGSPYLYAQGRPRQAAALAVGKRRPAKPRGHRADRRSAQRRAAVHQPDAGGLHQAAQPADRSSARRRRRRAGRLRGGAAGGHLALPARDPARVPARAHRRAADRRAARQRPAAVSRGGDPISPSSSPTPPTATATRRSAIATRSMRTSARARCSPT